MTRTPMRTTSTLHDSSTSRVSRMPPRLRRTSRPASPPLARRATVQEPPLAKLQSSTTAMTSWTGTRPLTSGREPRAGGRALSQFHPRPLVLQLLCNPLPQLTVYAGQDDPGRGVDEVFCLLQSQRGVLADDADDLDLF